MIDEFDKTYTDWSIDVGAYKYEGSTTMYTKASIIKIF